MVGYDVEKCCSIAPERHFDDKTEIEHICDTSGHYVSCSVRWYRFKEGNQ